MENEWNVKFPNVHFTDKVAVIIDGEAHVIKHLYSSDEELNDIDWEKVSDCFDV